MRAIGLLCVAALSVSAACSERERLLRGSVEASPDGHTYLAIADDNGGRCGPLKVDGKLWPHAIGEKGQVEAGIHVIECGTTIEVKVDAGTVFTFDYWGP